MVQTVEMITAYGIRGHNKEEEGMKRESWDKTDKSLEKIIT